MYLCQDLILAALRALQQFHHISEHLPEHFSSWLLRLEQVSDRFHASEPFDFDARNSSSSAHVA
jgi:hypothetical protein